MFPTLQCRKCMRKLHQHEPLHRIECWTGKFFRPASMWEVGGYLLIKHHGETGLCETLKFQKDLLDDIQGREDSIDQDACRAAAATDDIAAAVDFSDTANIDTEINWSLNHGGEFSNDENTDTLIMAEMDRIHDERQVRDGIEIDEILQDGDNDEGEKDCIDETFNGFKEYMSSTASGMEYSGTAINGTASSSSIPSIYEFDEVTEPKKDAFNNHCVRIAHVNGIHHLTVVTCTCRGVDNLPIDLMYSRLVPTSFTHIRTLFTTMALDTFRLANLEMKASAYQYFQLIHRLTSKTTKNVPNLYSDLRKLSRAWRWMKKLKWAGYGHKTADATSPAAGELTLFCPACPQPNINLPADWKTDPNRLNRFFILFRI
jgi:hypothetical protein